MPALNGGRQIRVEPAQDPIEVKQECLCPLPLDHPLTVNGEMTDTSSAPSAKTSSTSLA